MALLRLSDGRVYVTHEDIAPRIGSVRIGKFDYPEAARREVEALSMPLTDEGIDVATSKIDPAALALANSEGFVHRRIGCVVPSKQDDGPFTFAFGPTAAEYRLFEQPIEDVISKLRPHIVDVPDWHFVLSGAIIKGLQLEDGLQGVLYVTEGEWICLTPKAVNWVIASQGQPTIGISYFPKPLGAFQQVDFPEVQILPNMRS